MRDNRSGPNPQTWLSTVPIAHRGLHDSYIQPNTIAAITAAQDAGYAAEFDVIISADGVPFVSHDYAFRTKAGKRRLLSRSQSSLILEGTSQTTYESIPTLASVLSAASEATPLYLDIKPTGRAFRQARLVASAIDGSRLTLAVLSFDPRVLIWFRHHRPQVIRGQSAGAFDGWRALVAAQYPVYAMPFNGIARPHFLAYELNLAPNRALDAWRNWLEVPLITWGVRTLADASRARMMSANIMFDEIRPNTRSLSGDEDR